MSKLIQMLKVGALAATTGLASCAHDYSTGMANDFRSTPFSDRDYNAKLKVLHVGPHHHIAFTQEINSLTDEVTVDGKAASLDIFPYAAIDVSPTRSAIINPSRKNVDYTDEGKNLIAFKRDPTLQYIVTNVPFTNAPLDESRQVYTMPEPSFTFNQIATFKRTKGNLVVGYGEFQDTDGKNKIVIVRDPFYRTNGTSGLVELRGSEFYVQADNVKINRATNRPAPQIELQTIKGTMVRDASVPLVNP